MHIRDRSLAHEPFWSDVIAATVFAFTNEREAIHANIFVGPMPKMQFQALFIQKSEKKKKFFKANGLFSFMIARKTMQLQERAQEERM